MTHGRTYSRSSVPLRKPNTDAIAAMALDNYLEMRERVADPKFQLQQALSWNSNGAFRGASSRATRW